MTTIITAYDGSGKCTGRCDARCYNAKHDKCECVCGGRNHGTGYKGAVDNTIEMFADAGLDDVKGDS